MWRDFVKKKNQFIGRTLTDYGDSMDRSLGCKPKSTVITDINLNPNGDDSMFFSIVGKDFTCGFDVSCGGLSCLSTKDALKFVGYNNHNFEIQHKGRNNEIKRSN